MSKYHIAIWEEISGFIDVEAESKEKAEEIAEELMFEHGVEKIFYPQCQVAVDGDPFDEEDLTKYNGKHTHRSTEVLTCEEVNE